MKLFLSYRFNSNEEIFASKVHFHLEKQPKLEIFYWDSSGEPGPFKKQIKSNITFSDYLIFFWGEELGSTQKQEIKFAMDEGRMIIPIKLPNNFDPKPLSDDHKLISEIKQLTSIPVSNIEKEDIKCAKDIIKKIGRDWISEDGLPLGYPFDYEKDIIIEYIEGNGKLSPDRVKQGCPLKWPIVERLGCDIESPISKDDIGAFRDWDDEKKIKRDPQVVPAALADYHPSDKNECLIKMNLTFPEAGPRKFLHFPKSGKQLNIGILVSGGIAPGINSVISGIVKRHVLYDSEGEKPHENLNIWGYPEGFKSLMRDRSGPDRKLLYSSNNPQSNSDQWLEKTVYGKSDTGGSIIPTSREDDLLDSELNNPSFKDIISNLDLNQIDILYIIGGDGSMKAAHAITNYALTNETNISVIAIPKTMDNDIFWVWQSFGFLSAVEWAKGAIRQIHTEVTSNPRLCIIQLFGSDSGFVVSHAALASGVCDLVLIPEIDFSTKKVIEYIKEKLKKRFILGTNGSSPYGIILLAEAAIPTDGSEPNILKISELSDLEKKAIKKYMNDDRRVNGQTPDDLRNAGLKIIKNTIRDSLKNEDSEYWRKFRVFTNEPRHLIRSISPSSSDIIIGERLGSLAVDGAMSGYKDFMISQWLTEYVLVPLKLVVLGRKRIPRKGIFWKSVRANTGQPTELK